MDSRGWPGHLLAHVHEKWALAEMTQLECLLNGANGIWASVCEEGAAVGHACSTVTLMNLVRMGNTKVQASYNCTYLRKASINVTEITTGSPPHPKQVIYGERALDWAFDFKNIAGGRAEKTELSSDLPDGGTAAMTPFNLPKFFGEKAPVRISAASDARMIHQRLVDLFEDDSQFTTEMAKTMKETILRDLMQNEKLEYMTKVGIALLFKRSGGNLTVKMIDEIEKAEVSVHAQHLINEVRKTWDVWDIKDNKEVKDHLTFRSFHIGFMTPYFPNFESSGTQEALKEIDLLKNGYIDWNEFLVYLKWAMDEYPGIEDVDELLSVAFRKGKGGNLTVKMTDVIEKAKVSVHAQHLINEVRKIWDKWDIEENKEVEDHLTFQSFYNGFMAPYFSCFACSDTQKALKQIDLLKNGYIDWNEFLMYLKWAMREYPSIKEVDELLSVAFRKGIIPAMHALAGN